MRKRRRKGVTKRGGGKYCGEGLNIGEGLKWGSIKFQKLKIGVKQ